MKRVLVYAPSNRFLQEASLRLRILALVEPMKNRGFDWTVIIRPKSPWGRAALAFRARRFDAVILQRKWLDPFEARILRRSGARIFMDIDDATMFHETKLGAIARLRLERRVNATLSILHVLCAGNAYLADIFREKRSARAAAPLPVHLIPTAVNPADYPMKSHAPTDKPRLVWLGSHSTLKYLEQAFDALATAAAEIPGLSLTVVCDRAPGAAPIPLEFIPWSLESEKIALAHADIGIAPTPSDRWTLGKCGFKIIQYMAAGLPVIASPVGVNTDLTQNAGLLAQSPADWKNAIARLAANVELRRQYGAAGRARVEMEFSLEHAADLWAAALSG